MKNKHNPYFRLQTYMTMLAQSLEARGKGLTIKDLHQLLDIPLSVIRNDLLVMINYKRGYMPDFADISKAEENSEAELSPAYQSLSAEYCLEDLLYSSDNEDLEEDERREYQKQLRELMLNGQMDQLPMTYDRTDDSQDTLLDLNLSSSEYQALKSLYRDREEPTSKDNFKTSFYIKENYRFRKLGQYADKLQEILRAIEYDYCLKVEYLPNSGNKRTLDLKPLKVIYDSVNNEYALITINKHAVEIIRLTTILNIYETKEKLEVPPKDLKLLEHLPQVWGMEFNNKPVAVKIRFYNVARVWEKVRRDLSYRTEGRLYEKGSYLYYEDTVRGLYSFKSWLLSYGSAAIVEEPPELRKIILDSLHKRA